MEKLQPAGEARSHDAHASIWGGLDVIASKDSHRSDSFLETNSCSLMSIKFRGLALDAEDFS